MRGPIAAAILVGLAVAGAPAQEPIVYKDYAFKKGDVTRTTRTDDTTRVTAFQAAGKEQKTVEKTVKTVIYRTEVLAVGADPAKPGKLRRTYEKAVEVTDGAETKLPLHGRTVVIERAGETYSFLQADGTALPEKAAAELDRSFNKAKLDARDLFPKGGVKAGDTWDLTETFLKGIGTADNPLVFDTAAAKVTGKLLAATKTGGATVGDFRITGDLPLTAVRGEQPVRLEPGGKNTFTMTGRGALDGSSPENTLTATMKVRFAGTVMGLGLKMDHDAKQTEKTERVTGAK
ncbi:hypothetical protein J0H58_30345 [bacterium]|nr:hypothetical protein [bacterium]